mgnify:CR=1 FL=1
MSNVWKSQMFPNLDWISTEVTAITGLFGGESAADGVWGRLGHGAGQGAGALPSGGTTVRGAAEFPVQPRPRRRRSGLPEASSGSSARTSSSRGAA